MADDARRFFFVHVMKTGGTSLLTHLGDTFPPDAVEPDVRRAFLGEVAPPTYASVSRIRDLGPERRARVRVYSGHYPAYVAAMVEVDEVITLLREPVDRTVSMLRQTERNDPRKRGWPLERIYDDAIVRSMLLQDYQSKQFALTAEDVRQAADLAVRAFGPGADATVSDRPHLINLPVDGARVEAAKRVLESLSVVGIHERMPEVLDELGTRYGWRFPVERHIRHGSSASDGPAPPALRARIERDNPADVELYGWALDRWERRHR